MRSKKSVVVAVVLIIVMTLIIIFIINMSKDKKVTQNNIESIKKSYTLLSNSVSKYNEKREEFNKLSTDLILDDYEKKHDDFVTLFTDYNKIMSNIDSYVANIKAKCSQVSLSSEVGNICNGYEKTYEKLVNLYVNDINKCNDIITRYNDYKKQEISEIESVYDDYIDYNNDNIYEGRDSSEKN